MLSLSSVRWVPELHTSAGGAGIFDEVLQTFVVRHIASAELAREIAAALNEPASIVSSDAATIAAAVRQTVPTASFLH